MFEALSITTVAITVILLYVFRRPVKQLSNEAPEAISNVMSAAIKGAAQLDTIVSTNCLENQLDCAKRVKAVQDTMKEEKLPNVRDAYNDIMGVKAAS